MMRKLRLVFGRVQLSPFFRGALTTRIVAVLIPCRNAWSARWDSGSLESSAAFFFGNWWTFPSRPIAIPLIS
jgi:hypothetical protein